MKTKSLAQRILEKVKRKNSFTTEELYKLFPSEVKTTIRGRLYRDLVGKDLVEKIGPNTYKVKK